MATVARQGGPRKIRGCCFGPVESGALLTFTGSRWRLWREVDNDHSSEVAHSDPVESYSAACWGSLGSASSKAAASALYFALGCTSGHIQIWDSRSGEPVGPAAPAFADVVKGADAAVSAVALTSVARGSVFAACAAVAEVLEVGVHDGLTRSSFKTGKVGPVRLSAGLSGKDEYLLSACPRAALKLWQLGTATGAAPVQKARLAGPADSSTTLDVCSVGGKLLAMSGDGTMQVDVFVCGSSASSASEGKQPPAAANFVLSAHEQIREARFSRHQETEGRATVVAWGGTMVACWNFRLDKMGKNGAPKTVAASYVILASDLGGRVLSARPSEQASTLAVAYGPAVSPIFATCKAPAAKGEAPIIERAGVQTKAGETPATDAAAVQAKAKAKSESKEKPTPAQAVAAAQAAKPKQPTVLGPLETSVARKQPRRRAIGEVDGVEEEDAAMPRKRAKLPEGGKTLGGLSISPMVRQGLRAKDAASIEKVLQCADKKIIDSTVAELSGAEAFDLLQECTHRLLSQPVRGQVFCTWIQRVIVRHCSYLFSQPVLHRALQPLHDAFNSRCSSHKSLVRLRGRLLTLRNSGRANLEKSKAKASEDGPGAPLMEYHEGDEDVLAEDAAEEASSGEEIEGGSDDEDLDLDDSDDDILLEDF